MLRNSELGVIEMIKRKLTSRKMWLSIANFVSMLIIALGVSESEAAQVSALIMAGASVIGYVVAEGLADASPNGIIEVGCVDLSEEKEEG